MYKATCTSVLATDSSLVLYYCFTNVSEFNVIEIYVGRSKEPTVLHIPYRHSFWQTVLYSPLQEL